MNDTTELRFPSDPEEFIQWLCETIEMHMDEGANTEEIIQKMNIYTGYYLLSGIEDEIKQKELH